MKKQFFLGLLCFLPLPIFAQLIEEPLWVSFGGGVGFIPAIQSPNIQLQGSLRLKGNWWLEANLSSSSFTPPNLPQDFRSGTSIFGNNEPRNELSFANLLVAYNLINKPNWLRLKIKTGFSNVYYAANAFTYTGRTGGILFSPSNYDTELISQSSIGFPLSISTELIPFKWGSVQSHISADLNSVKSFWLCGLSFNFGNLR